MTDFTFNDCEINKAPVNSNSFYVVMPLSASDFTQVVSYLIIGEIIRFTQTVSYRNEISGEIILFTQSVAKKHLGEIVRLLQVVK